MPQRLVLFVEGKGDVNSLPILAKRVLTELNGTDALFVDPDPFRVNSLGAIVKNDCEKWRGFLGAAAKTRPNLAGVLLVLDGDLSHVPSTWKQYLERYGTPEFCAVRAATALVDSARLARAGEAFSVASTFIMMEFEAWLLAGIESLRGVKLPEGRGSVPATACLPRFKIEEKRNAKLELRSQLGTYRETLDQAELARHVDLSQVRRHCRSFRRFESAIRQLLDAARGGRAIITPRL